MKIHVLTAVLSVDILLGLTYNGKAADTWAVGVTLYCMILGEYPFLGDTLQDTYDKVCHAYIHIWITHSRRGSLFIFCHRNLSLLVFSSLIQIVNNPLVLPDDLNPQIRNLLEGLLCKGILKFCFLLFPALKIFVFSPNTGRFIFLWGIYWNFCFADPKHRMILGDVAQHSWVIGDDGPIPEYLCWCRRKRLRGEDLNSNMLA